MSKNQYSEAKILEMLKEYNYQRPHSSLGGLPPKIFLNQQNILNIDKNKNKNIVEEIVG